MGVISEIKKFVIAETKKPNAVYDFEIVEFHFEPVAKYAKILAKKRKANKEIVEISAWLHDIGSVIYGRKNHHITSAKIAEEKLRELKYPEEKIEKVKHCIFSHRGSQKIKRETKEAIVLAEADAMSHFDALPGLFRAYYVCEKKYTQGQAGREVRNKLINSYNKLSKDAKKIIEPKFKAAILLLSHPNVC
jgi:uncharacterized protein